MTDATKAKRAYVSFMILDLMVELSLWIRGLELRRCFVWIEPWRFALRACSFDFIASKIRGFGFGTLVLAMTTQVTWLASWAMVLHHSPELGSHTVHMTCRDIIGSHR